MLEIRIHGRGGQGAQVACQILADAFFRQGAWVQAFTAYGGERRGAPVIASLRVADAPIRDAGAAVLLVDHHMDFVLDLADEVLVLSYGEKLAEGTPSAVRRDPAVVAAYLGDESD